MRLTHSAVGIPIAAWILYSSVGVQLSPMIAAGAMAASGLSVVTNASRRRRWQPHMIEVDPVPAATEPILEVGADEPATPNLETDPVCGMELEIGNAAARADFDGVTYYFHSVVEIRQLDYVLN